MKFLFTFFSLADFIQAEKTTVDIIVTVPFDRTDTFGETYPFSRDYVEPALTWMNNKISTQQEEVEFNLTYKDSKCSKDGVALFWGDEFKPPRQNPLAFIGPVCEDAAIQAALSGKLFQFPIMTPGYFGANSLRHKEQFPTLVRTLPGFLEVALFIRKLFETLGYVQNGCRQKINLLYEYDQTNFDSMVKFREQLIHAVNFAFQEYNVVFDEFIEIEKSVHDDPAVFDYTLSKKVENIISDDGRPVSTIIIGNYSLAEKILREAKYQGKLNREVYDWFLIDLHSASTYLSRDWLYGRNFSTYEDDDFDMIEVISHLNVITQYQDDRYADEDQAQDFANFTEFVLEEYEKNAVESPLEEPGTFPRAFADTLYVFYILWRDFHQNKTRYEYQDAVPLINQLRHGFISNVFGEVMAFDENLELFGKYQVLQFKEKVLKWKQTATQTMIGECPDCKMSNVQIKDNHRYIEPLDCAGVASNTPPMIIDKYEDLYEVKYDRESMNEINTATWAGVIGAMIPTMVIFIVGSVLYWIYRKKKYAIVLVRSVSESRRQKRAKLTKETPSQKSSCKSTSQNHHVIPIIDPTLQRVESNRMSEELHVQLQVQDSVEDIEEIKPPKLIESKSILKKNMKSLRSKSEDSELFDEVCHSLTFDYH